MCALRWSIRAGSESYIGHGFVALPTIPAEQNALYPGMVLGNVRGERAGGRGWAVWVRLHVRFGEHV